VLLIYAGMREINHSTLKENCKAWEDLADQHVFIDIPEDSGES